MFDEKIFLCVGDDYEIVPYEKDAPCKLRDGTLLPLSEVKEKNVQGDFSIWTGSHWDNYVCLTDDVVYYGDFQVELSKQLSSDEHEKLLNNLWNLFKENNIEFVKHIRFTVRRP